MKSCAAIFGPGVVVVGDPVDVVTGASLDRQLDFTLAGPLPLQWFRWYSSARNWDTGGHGWGYAHDYERRLVFDLDGSRHYAPNGEVVRFPPLNKDGDFAAAEGYRLRRLNKRQYALAQAGQPTSVFEAPAGRTTFVLTGLQTKRAEIRFRYDADGLLHTITDSIGRPVRVEHDAGGCVARLTMPGPDGRPRRLAAYEYDPAGNLVKVTDPYGNSLRFRYDAEHRQVRRTDRRGYSYLFEYDAAGRCVKAGGEDGADGVRLDYDPALRTTLVTKAGGGQWLYQYDAAGMVIKVIDPDGGVQQSVMGPDGRVFAVLGPTGERTERLYDAAGTLIGTYDPFGYFHGTDEPDYDPHAYDIPTRAAEWVFGEVLFWEAVVRPVASDPVLAALGPAGRYIQTRAPGTPAGPTLEADDFGKPFRETFPDGSCRRWVYDANGNVIKFTDRDGGVTTLEIASRNAVVAEINPIGGRVKYEYATSGNATAVTDPGGTRSEYRYDLQDRLVEVRRHGVVRERYEHDPAGNLVCKRDGEGRELMRQELGPAGLPVSRTFATGEVQTFAYNEAGRDLQATGGGSTLAFRYDGYRPAADLRDGFGVEHTWGPDGINETLVFGQYQIAYRWESPVELAVTDPTGQKHRIRLLGGGLVERVLANGVRELDQYDDDGWCLGRITTSGPSVSRARVYRYSSEGCLTAAEDSARGTTRYRYDAAQRLVGVDRPDGTSDTIALDIAGNLLRMPGLSGVTLREGNRLLEANGERYEYNARNHLASRAGHRGIIRYHYDADDMLIRVETDGQPNWTAGYDPYSRRVWKQWGAKRTEFWWDLDRLIAERDETGRLRVYVYADHFALVPLLFVDYALGAEEPADGKVYTLHTNQIGARVEVRDDGGRVVWEAEYAPYGVADIRADGIELNLRFPGHYHDPETGLHYNRYRYYSPTLGRYLQSDPMGVEVALNLYAYSARPLDAVDLFGLEPEPYDRPPGTPNTSVTRKMQDPNYENEDTGVRGGQSALGGKLTGEKGDGTFAADHVMPAKEITEMKGYKDLSPAQQKALLNNPSNFMPLNRAENSSKCDKTVKEWIKDGCPKGTKMSAAQQKELRAIDKAARAEIKAHMEKMQADNKAAEKAAKKAKKPVAEVPPRACSGCDKGTYPPKRGT